MVRTQGNTLVRRISQRSVHQQRKVATADQSSSIPLSKNLAAAMRGQAVITEAEAALAVLHKEVEVVIAAEAEARASEEGEAAGVEAKEEDGVVVAGTEASTPMSVKATRATGAWSTRIIMRYATGATWCTGRRSDRVWTSASGQIGDCSLINADVF